MGQGSVDHVGEHRLDDRVLPVGDVGVGDRFGAVGEERVCAVRRCCSSGGERPPPLILSQQGGEAEGSLSREVPGWVGAALTKPGRASTARWCGSGERDGEEYERNQRLRLLNTDRLKSGGYGPGAVRNPVGAVWAGGGNFWVVLRVTAGRPR